MDKRADQEMRAYAARDTVEKAFRPPHECRAHEAGRCNKGDQCFEYHNVPYSLTHVLLGAGAEAESLPQAVSHVHFASSGQGVPVLPRASGGADERASG